MNKKLTFYIAASVVIVLCLTLNILAERLEISGPVGSGSFGQAVAVLPNGNVVVADPGFDIDATITDAGAIYLFNGRTGILISRVTGSCRNDNLGINGVKVLGNSFIFGSPNLDLISAGGAQSNFCIGGNQLVKPDAGAVTAVNGAGGLSGTVSALNSLVGSTNSGDKVGNTITVLPSGNYVVQSPFWNARRGAVTFGAGGTPLTGEVSAANSLIGSTEQDLIGSVSILANGNYVVSSSSWNSNRGAATLCAATAGCTGEVSAANSLIGNPGDYVSIGGITVLTNGNYVVQSRMWNGQRGAVTFGNGTTGTTGVVSASNSLVGTAQNELVGGGGVTRLTNGNYVVGTHAWNGQRGAATFGNGTTGVVGTISESNSLVGTNNGDFYLGTIVALSNGNYVVFNPYWDAPAGSPGGAVTWGNGATGVVGQISASNSLTNISPANPSITPLDNGNYVIVNPGWNGSVGAVTLADGTTSITGTISAANSLVGNEYPDNIGGSGVTALVGGKYVVNSSGWNNQRGASTFCPATGCTGGVSAANSLTGTVPLDRVGGGGAVALTNGNYVVRSYYWNDYRGAATFGNGSGGTVGEVSAANSLVGANSSDWVGDLAVVPISGGNFIVVTRGWNQSRGAVTWGSGTTGVSGVLSASNSLVGSSMADQVGFIGNTEHGIKTFTDGRYLIRSDWWDNAGASDAGAISFGHANTAITGLIDAGNSIQGTAQFGGFRMSVDYNPAAKILAVGHANNRVTLEIFAESRPSPFDFDGDGKTDLSIFRPSVGEWWYQKSSNGGNYAAQFGASTDKITPGDFTGDGKTDIAIWRPSSGEWFILRSEDASYYSFPFGANGDIPAVGDFDGDGKTDATIFRPSNATWYISKSSGGTLIQQFGQNGDVPVVADYDGDGKSDIAIYRVAAGEWWIQRSAAGLIAFQFGNSSDKPVPGDFTGDGKADVALFRPSSGEWFILRSENQSFYSFPFGTTGDVPAPGDYDGDGKFDATVFRPSSSTWYAQRSTAGTLIQAFGQTGDTPVPNAFVP